MNQIKTISKKDLNNFINKLIADKTYEVVGVKSKGKRYVFDILEDSSELCLDHDVTIIPPKKYFLPQYEKLMEYNLEKQFEVKPNIETKSRIIIGIHPYDVIAL